MANESKPGKQTVELQPSRIRRDPPPAAATHSMRWLRADLSERETWVVVVGVAFFAIAFAIITVGLSDFTSK